MVTGGFGPGTPASWALGLGRPPTNKRLLLPFGETPAARSFVCLACPGEDSYLVDSASSHMLVSKIKPCMSKYKQLYCETANGSLNQLSFI